MPFASGVNQAVLDHIFQLSAGYAQPGNLSVALSTTTPAADGTNVTEPSGNGYARVATTSADWGRVGNDVTNGNRLDFPEATGTWGTVTYFVLYDGTTVIAFGALTSSQNVVSGQQPYFDVDDITVRYL